MVELQVMERIQFLQILELVVLLGIVILAYAFGVLLISSYIIYVFSNIFCGKLDLAVLIYSPIVKAVRLAQQGWIVLMVLILPLFYLPIYKFLMDLKIGPFGMQRNTEEQPPTNLMPSQPLIKPEEPSPTSQQLAKTEKTRNDK